MINKYKISELKTHLFQLGINENEIKNKPEFKNNLQEIFVKIKNNTLEAFIPFANKEFKNNWRYNIHLYTENYNLINLNS